MVDDAKNSEFLTFGGYHQVRAGVLAASADAWSYDIPPEDGVMPAFPSPSDMPTETPQVPATGVATPESTVPAATQPVAAATPTAETAPAQSTSANVLVDDTLPVLQPGGDLFGATLDPADSSNPPA
jgi:hypothetical protein